jgi:hypothetical protein
MTFPAAIHTTPATAVRYYAALAADVDLVTARPGYATDKASPALPRGFIVGGAGNLSFSDNRGNTVTFPAVAGVLYPIGCCATMLLATTTATQILVLW